LGFSVIRHAHSVKMIVFSRKLARRVNVRSSGVGGGTAPNVQETRDLCDGLWARRVDYGERTTQYSRSGLSAGGFYSGYGIWTRDRRRHTRSGRAQTSGGVKAKFALPVPTVPFTSSSRTWARPWHRRRRRGRAPGSAPSTPDGGWGGRGAGDGAKRSSGRGRRRLPARPRARGGSCRRWPAGWRIRVAATAGRAPAIAAEMAVDCGMAVAAAEVVAVTAVAAVEVAVAAAAATAGAVARQ